MYFYFFHFISCYQTTLGWVLKNKWKNYHGYRIVSVFIILHPLYFFRNTIYKFIVSKYIICKSWRFSINIDKKKQTENHNKEKSRLNYHILHLLLGARLVNGIWFLDSLVWFFKCVILCLFIFQGTASDFNSFSSLITIAYYGIDLFLVDHIGQCGTKFVV